MDYAYIASNLLTITQEIKTLASPATNLVAVSKTFPAAAVREAYLAGQRHFGENYPQELAGKAEELTDCPELVWHFIGTIQSNKTKLIAKHASWVHTLTSLSHARRLHEQRPANLPPLQVLIEVKINPDPSKHGLTSLAEITKLTQGLTAFPRLQLRGLMGMATDSDNPQLITKQFQQLASYLTELNQDNGWQLDQLSMGMSQDYQLAIACGATLLRIGSKIFGVRTYDN